MTLRMQAATALLGGLLCNCSENNEGQRHDAPAPERQHARGDWWRLERGRYVRRRQ